jgi:hypothetical protein
MLLIVGLLKRDFDMYGQYLDVNAGNMIIYRDVPAYCCIFMWRTSAAVCIFLPLQDKMYGMIKTDRKPKTRSF